MGTRGRLPIRSSPSSAGPRTSLPSTGSQKEHRRCRPAPQAGVGATITHWLYEHGDADRLEVLKSFGRPRHRALAAKIDGEEAYHRMHADTPPVTDEGRRRLERGGRRALALRVGVLGGAPRGSLRARAEERLGRVLSQVEVVPRGVHGGGARGASRGDDDGAALGAGGCAVVTVDERVALSLRSPTPEIPVISRLPGRDQGGGVVDDRAADRDFSRCGSPPRSRLCNSRCERRWRQARRRGGCVHVVLDDLWSNYRITPQGRDKVREAASRHRHRDRRRSSRSSIQRWLPLPGPPARRTPVEPVRPTPCRLLSPPAASRSSSSRPSERETQSQLACQRFGSRSAAARMPPSSVSRR